MSAPIILLSTTVSLLCLPVGIAMLKKAQMGQYIQGDGPAHAKKAQTPTSAGVFIFILVAIITIVYTGAKTQALQQVLWVWAGYVAIGFYDDISKVLYKNNDKGLSPRAKLVWQCVVALYAIYAARQMLGDGLTTIAMPYGGWTFDMGLGYYCFAMAMMLGASNAFNITDGLDGLLGGLVCMVCAGLLVYFSMEAGGYMSGDTLVEFRVLLSSLMGVFLGFLWFNCFPAAVFLGDSGSLSVGALLAYVAILAKAELYFGILCGVLIVETVSVIVQVCYFKITGGKRILKMAPLHHHYEILGLKEPKIVMRFWIAGLIFLMIGLCLIV